MNKARDELLDEIIYKIYQAMLMLNDLKSLIPFIPLTIPDSLETIQCNTGRKILDMIEQSEWLKQSYAKITPGKLCPYRDEVKSDPPNDRKGLENIINCIPYECRTSSRITDEVLKWMQEKNQEIDIPTPSNIPAGYVPKSVPVPVSVEGNGLRTKPFDVNECLVEELNALQAELEETKLSEQRLETTLNMILDKLAGKITRIANEGEGQQPK